MSKRPIIFTDLDGTLLDHHSYSPAAALPTLRRLQQQQTPIIPTTSKTFAELQQLRQQLKLHGPFIIENGAAIYIPKDFFPHKPTNSQWQQGYWLHHFTSHKQVWLNLLQQEGKPFAGQFSHFSTMSIAQICAATGLQEQQAKLAAQRQYGEPVLWLGDEQSKTAFCQKLNKRGATTLQGGRFLHISGNCDKGEALNWFMAEYKRQYPQYQCFSIALGDGHNDSAMLAAADVAVRILSPVHPPVPIDKKENVFTSTLYGPQGWAEVLSSLLPETLQEA